MHENAHMILAATAERLPLGGRTGFVPMGGREAARLFEAAGLWLGPRDLLEGTAQFRQIIPYVVLQVGSRLIRYTRTTSGKEARLHGRVSIGLGGHVDLGDVVARGAGIDLLGTLDRAAAREVSEEVGDAAVARRRWVGLLVDDATAVGRAHIGLAAVWHLERLPDGRPEDAIGAPSAETVAALGADPDRLEAWSAMLLPHLDVPRLEIPHLDGPAGEG